MQNEFLLHPGGSAASFVLLLQPTRVPLRWYPPEYFKNNYYSFKGDVWAFGIVLWEMQTFGTLPYPNLETSEEVVFHICMGHKNTNPEGCRAEM
ncbi:PREDICTED: tyrosine-protein kinase CSK-like isoform X2 [Cyprinodon variegatus]|uniref:tyrosine-protein kinase CSK-like isoform X2 n=1 Tax=Cyprinodon variegatus TaxID=28743 RepID=UPI000742B8CF|nr:PREDICTED: tyrosine-protein kinase CSK-like isoform X2 [Cyprinodon variegatus]